MTKKQKNKTKKKKTWKKRRHWGSVSLVVGWRIDCTRLKRDEHFSPGGRTAFLFCFFGYFAAKVTPVEAHWWQPVFCRDLHRFQEKVSTPERRRETAAHARPYLNIPSAFHHPRYMFSYHLRIPSEIPGRAREGHRRSAADFRNK